MGNMDGVRGRNFVGSALDRDTGILHAGVCHCRADSDTGLGNDSSSGQSLRDKYYSLHTPRMLAAHSAVIAGAYTRRQYGLGIFPDTTNLGIARDTFHDVYIPEDSKRQDGLTWKY